MTNDESRTTGRSEPLYRRAFHILAAEIRDGRSPPGMRLTEPRTAARFGISRAPVRQALALLAEAGLVIRSEGRTVEVAPGAADKARRLLPDAYVEAESSRLASRAGWEPIHSEVEGEIVARIAFGSWRLREEALARHYGVSRTIARDVIARLQQGGLIEKDEAGRWFAPALSPDRIAELYELRALLEPVALKKAAQHLPPGAVAAAIGRLEAAIAAGQVEGETLDALERDLHVEILGYGTSRTLLRTIRQHQSLLVAHRFLYRWTSRMFGTEPFLAEHLRVLVSLQVGDLAGAAAALRAHLLQSSARAVARVNDVNTRFEPEDLAYLKPE
jgi:DNA-binding GntR family transcriptional regulator